MIKSIKFAYPHNYHRILGTNSNSSKQDIKRKYIQLTKIYHPDIDPLNKQKFFQIKEAYEHLSSQKFNQNIQNDFQSEKIPIWNLFTFTFLIFSTIVMVSFVKQKIIYDSKRKFYIQSQLI